MSRPVSHGEKPVHSRAGVLRTSPLEVAKGGKNPGPKVTALEAEARAKGVSLRGSQGAGVGGKEGPGRGVQCRKQPS